MFDEDFDDDQKTGDRAFYRYLFLALLIPAIAVGALALFAKGGSGAAASAETQSASSASFKVDLTSNGAQRLQRAAALLDNFTRIHPPNHMWRQQGVKVIDGRTIKMTVDVPYGYQAKTIITRRPRIKYNYVTLACPPEKKAGLDSYLNSDDRIVVELRYDGEKIAEGTCPRHPFSL